MKVSVTSSVDLLEHPAHTVAPANEEQCALGLVVQPVTLGAPHENKGAAQQEPVQEQGAGEVGWHVLRMPTCSWRTMLLSGRNALLLVMVYLVVVLHLSIGFQSFDAKCFDRILRS